MPVKKYLLLVITIALSFFANNAKAQYYNNTFREDSWHVTIGPDIFGVLNPNQYIDNTNTKLPPIPNIVSRLGIGGTVHAEYYPNPFVGLTLGTGVEFFKASGNGYKNQIVVPGTIGAKAFFSQTMYLGAEAGLAYTTLAYKDSHIAKIVSPALGYNDNNTGLDISLRYELLHSKNQYMTSFGLHIAYSFDLSPTF
ncbi:hypothetical protein [Mucilaginibacter polytrichastri]|uniref:Outer membrane protein beta-barrel domain-containing protein n=1 Tax=Mucilaginibacter polytrichastri TaxID=1302689 RepID=A0A1Q5ZTP0_9SPHI|nr:hypothetical protein [Mucilaginibacter polytrichastri]OKS85131.1 hypothetical protein RG47T_0575 [Mucilaginibacter polytrichastri]SFS44021.1 hypothetical protein SAMN04487890_101508 [Mucilaginibacter polytrichastri]